MKKKQKKVKAWAVLSLENTLSCVELSKKHAQMWGALYLGENRTVPCTITYQITD